MKERPIRKLPRLPRYDYSQNGVYFVTICSENRKQIFGDIFANVPPIMELNPLGLTLQNAIKEIPSHHKDVQILKHVIMPSHVHLLLEINSVDLISTSTNLSRIVKGFKAYVSRTARGIGVEGKVWQKSFHDHIIRDEIDLETHYEYIISNIDQWHEDEYCNLN